MLELDHPPAERTGRLGAEPVPAWKAHAVTFFRSKSMNFQQFLFFPCTGLTVSRWIRPSFVPSPAHSWPAWLLLHQMAIGNSQHGYLSVSDLSHLLSRRLGLDDAMSPKRIRLAPAPVPCPSQRGPARELAYGPPHRWPPAVNASSRGLLVRCSI